MPWKDFRIITITAITGMENSRYRRGSGPPPAPRDRPDRLRTVTMCARGEWMAAASRTEERLRRRTARIGVLGLGYVGLRLAVEFAKAGFQVVGFEINEQRVAELNRGRSYIQDVPTREVRDLVREGKLRGTMNFDELRRMDVIDICVPTPLRKTKDPDVSFILAAVREIAPRLQRGQLVVLESTTYPGTTDELVLPLLQRDSWKIGRDFYLAFSPERVDPGNPTYRTHNIPKVVGGVTPACSRAAVALYATVVDRVVPVAST